MTWMPLTCTSLSFSYTKKRWICCFDQALLRRRHYFVMTSRNCHLQVVAESSEVEKISPIHTKNLPTNCRPESPRRTPTALPLRRAESSTSSPLVFRGHGRGQRELARRGGRHARAPGRPAEPLASAPAARTQRPPSVAEVAVRSCWPLLVLPHPARQGRGRGTLPHCSWSRRAALLRPRAHRRSTCRAPPVCRG